MESLDYCKWALQSVSRSFALTIPLVEEALLAPIMVGYLEARILDTFEDDIGKRHVSLEERVHAMNAIMEILERPDSQMAKRKAKELAREAEDWVQDEHYRGLVKNFDKVLTVHRSLDERTKASMVRWMHEMNAGMQKYLQQPVYSFEDLNEYCYFVAGTPSGFLTELIRTRAKKLTPKASQVLQDNERDFGLFLQKVNIIRDFREDILQNEKIFWPGYLFDKHQLEPQELLDPTHEKQAMEMLNAMVNNAVAHVTSVHDYLTAVPDEYAGFRQGAAINFAMGVATLGEVRGNRDVFYGDRPVKITHETRDLILENPLGYVAS
ncbi:MAG: squalene/phytoene synthase family protein [Candidatus Poseidoniia archaeon]|nr:squalene/phytoene synthase family protein [Candidatus Poseidoniia archaeon]MDP7136419.1 squalene/phytoene synthase family protein [Candidatus Poseidoniia archaeon]MDP7243616.1 squalene/phytoene synthase family protein [Candidatus Poseidoniia archaeon]MDP7590758.1 squalene/phytoene synthase family protein [Candidatus Poseidoniia archaeon]MDP7607840.1 squalene/phytoene synthase family protein [Candidatus Poseidoniia archaeon]